MLKFLFQESQYRPILKLWFAIGVFWIVSNLFQIWIGHPLLNKLPSVFISLTMVFVSGADHIPQQQRTIAIVLRGIGVLTGLLALGLWLVAVIQLLWP
jgi:hypothetical protein